MFPQFLKYLYIGQINISLQTAMPVLALADKYDIKDLVQLCVEYMLKHVAKAAHQGKMFLVRIPQFSKQFQQDTLFRGCNTRYRSLLIMKL